MRFPFKFGVLLAIFLIVCTGQARAADLLWDANAGTAGQTDGAGTWLNANQWWTGAANATWNNSTPDNATIGNGGTGGSITMGAVGAGTVTFTNFTGTYTLSGGSLTNSGGITVATNAGAVTITSTIGGAGGLTKNNTGYLNIRTATLSYTGTTTINGGTILFQSNYSPGNLTINDGVLEDYWNGTFSRSLGSGAGAFQILGGISGFSGQGDWGLTVKINNDTAYEVVWGSTYFSPSTLVLQAPTANSNGDVNFQNKLDLNGATRTILVNRDPAGTTGAATMSGIIRNSSGTPAGFIKTGPGTLILSAANTYDGGTTLNAGKLTLSNGSALGTGTLTINGGSLYVNNGAFANNNNIIATASFTIGGGNTATTGTGTFQLSQAITITGGGGNDAGNAEGITFSNVITDTSGSNTLNALDITWNLNGASTTAMTLGGAITLRDNQSLNAIGVSHITSDFLVKGAIGDGGNNYSVTYVNNGAPSPVSGYNRGPGVFLMGANTYTGDTIINSGAVINLGKNGTVGSLSPSSAIVNSGVLAFYRSNTITQGTDFGTIFGSGTIVQSGSGTTVFNTTNNYTGVTYVTGGTLSFDSVANAGINSPLGAYAAAGAAGILLNGGTFTYTGATAATDRGFTMGGNTTINVSAAGSALTFGASSLGAYTLTVTGGAGSSLNIGDVALTGNATLSPAINTTISGAISGSYGITKAGAGTLSFVVGGSCSNSAVTVSSGTLSVSVTNNTMQWVCGNLTNSAASTLEFAFGETVPSTTVAPLQVNGNVDFSASAPTVNCNGSGLTGLALGAYPLMKWTGNISGFINQGVVSNDFAVLYLDIPNKTLWMNITANKQPLTWQGPSDSEWKANEVTYTYWQDATPAATYYQESNAAGTVYGDSVVFSNAPGGTVTLNTTVYPASVLFAGTSNYTITGSGSIGGSAGLTKYGTNTQTLDTANTYLGMTTINAGTLKGSADGALGMGVVSIASGGALHLTHSNAVASSPEIILQSSGSAMLADTEISVSNLTFNFGANYTMAGNTMNFLPGAVIKCIDNRYNITITNAITGSPAVETKDSGAGDQYQGFVFAPSIGTQTLGEIKNPNNTGNTDKAGVYLSGSTTGNSVSRIYYVGGDRYGTVYKQGTGSWSVGDVITGTIRLSAGDLIANGTLAAGYFGILITGGVLHYNNPGAASNTTTTAVTLVLSGGNLDNSSGAAITTSSYNPKIQISSNFTFIGSQGANSDLYLGTGIVNVAAVRTVTVSDALTTLTIGGSITNAGGITKSGDGTLKLTGGNSYGGDTTVNAGRLLVTKTVALPGYNTASRVSVASGATLAVQAGGAGEWLSAELDSLLGATTAAFASGSRLGIEVTGGNIFTYANDIGATEAGKGFTKYGNGTMILTGVNTHSGATIITNGTLIVTVGDSCANSDLTLSPSSGTGTLGVSVTNNTMQWTCQSLTTAGGGTNSLIFDFSSVTPSTTVAPLKATGSAAFTVTPKVVITNGVWAGRTYPLIEWSSTSGTPPGTSDLVLGPGINGTLSVIGNTLCFTYVYTDPAVDNAGTANQTANSCTLQGLLTNGVVASGWICWGDNDGGATVTSAWDNVVSVGTVTQGFVFSTVASSLSSNVTYWYRCYVTNEVGVDWSDEANYFNATPSSGGGGGYKMKISFTNYNRTETLTNFPALVVLSNGMAGTTFDFGTFLSANGYDLRFWGDDALTTDLNYEIERWSTGSSSYVWVQVPQLYSNCYIWATWADSTKTNQPTTCTNGYVWSEGYSGVWHYPDGTTLSCSDSSGTGSPGTLNGTPLPSAGVGQIDGAAILNGSSGYISNPYVAARNLNGSFALQLWFKRISYIGSWPGVMGTTGWKNTSGGGWGIWYGAADSTLHILKQNQQPSLGTTSDTDYDHFAVSYDGVDLALYKNGVQVSKSATAYTTDNNTAPLIVGRSPDNNYGNFYMDEFRLSTVSRSSNWVWACWMNQGTNHSSFAEYGGIQSSIPIVNLAPTAITNNSAVLNATLNCSTTSCDVWVHWGSTDQTTNFSWASSAFVGSWTNVASTNVCYTNSSFAPDSTYYYTFRATNATGNAWATPSWQFTTLKSGAGSVFMFW